MNPKLRANLFWIILGVFVAVDAALYFVLVVSAGENIDAKRRTLAGNKTQLRMLANEEKMRTDVWVEHFQTLKGRYDDQYAACIEFFRNQDALLESYFPDVLLASGKPIPVKFRSIYEDRMNELRRSFAEKIPTEEPGFPIESVQNETQMQLAMKRYWIHEDLAKAMQEAQVQTFKGIRFGKTAPGEHELYAVHPLELACEMPFRYVPILAKKILEKERMFRFAKVTVAKPPWSKTGPDNTPYLKVEFPDNESYKASRDEDHFPEPPVLVTLALEVLDFEFPTE